MGFIDRIVRAFSREDDEGKQAKDEPRIERITIERQAGAGPERFVRDDHGNAISVRDAEARGWWVDPRKTFTIKPSDEGSAARQAEPFRWDDEALTWRNRDGDEVWDNPDATDEQLTRADERRAQDRPDPNGLTVPAEWTADDPHEPEDAVVDEPQVNLNDYPYNLDADEFDRARRDPDYARQAREEATRQADEAEGHDSTDPETGDELRASLERLDPPDQAHDRALIEDAIREAEGIGSIQGDPQAERDLGDRAAEQARYEARQDADPKGRTAGEDGSANLTQLNAIVADMQAQQAAQAKVAEVEAAAAQGGQDMAYPPPAMAQPVQTQAPTQSASSGGAA